MKELDHNQKARFADYINGKPVRLSDEELQMLAENDDLAAECLQIAEIAQMAESETATKSKGKSRIIKMLAMAAAACFVAGMCFIAFSSGEPQSASQHPKPSLSVASAPAKGYTELPEDFEKYIETASVEDHYFDVEPNKPFDITLSKSYDSDTLVLCNSDKIVLLRAKVNSNTVPIEGLSEGLYFYYLIYNPKEKGALTVGQE